MVAQEYDIELPAVPESARNARDVLAGLGRLDGQLLFDAQLLVSELIANSVTHAGLAPSDAIRLRLTVTEERLRVEVIDAGDGFTARKHAEPSGGGGFLLLQGLSSRFGIVRERTTCAWFEIDL